MHTRSEGLRTRPDSDGVRSKGIALEADAILAAWRDRLARESRDDFAPALAEAAPSLVREILSTVTHDGSAARGASALDIDFRSHTLERVIFEARILRSVVLSSLPGDRHSGDRDYVLCAFDSFLARASSRAARDPRSRQSWIVHGEAGHDLPKDSRFIASPLPPHLIDGAIVAEREANDLARARVLRGRADFLAHASKALSATMDYRETISRIASLAVSNLADWCILDAVDEDDAFRRGAVLHRDPAVAGLAEELRRDFGPHSASKGVPSHVLRTGETLLIPRVTDDHYAATARSPRHEEILRGLGSGSYMCVPMIARGHFVGALTLVTNRRAFGPEDVVFAEEFASRCALAVDNAIQFLRTQRALAMRDEFIGVVSHDLKNPLQVIDMSANMLQLGSSAPDKAKIDRLSGTIRATARRMNRLISDLLDLSRFEAGQFRVERKREPLRALFAELSQGYGPLAAAKSIALVLPERVDLTVEYDRARLVQAVGNLVSNALKFTAEGGTIRLGARAEEGFAVIEVEDSGCGMPPEALTRIFDRFWQARASESRRGTGIGLSIVKMMVEAHGGTVSVESEPGRGTRFSIRIPSRGSGALPVF